MPSHNLRSGSQFILLLAAALICASCGPSAEELAATYLPQTEAAATATSTPQPTPTVTLTATVTSTNTAEPTATSTSSPTPEPVAVVGDTDVNLRAGPGTEYDRIGGAAAGERLEVLGQALECAWLKVRLLGVGEGWVAANVVNLLPSCDQLAVVDIPPTPVVSGPISPPISSGSDEGESIQAACSGTPHNVRVNNKTGESVTLSFFGPCQYFFTLPPGNGQIIAVIPGQYTIAIDYCGRIASGVHAINANWFIDLKC